MIKNEESVSRKLVLVGYRVVKERPQTRFKWFQMFCFRCDEGFLVFLNRSEWRERVKPWRLRVFIQNISASVCLPEGLAAQVVECLQRFKAVFLHLCVFIVMWLFSLILRDLFQCWVLEATAACDYLFLCTRGEDCIRWDVAKLSWLRVYRMTTSCNFSVILCLETQMSIFSAILKLFLLLQKIPVSYWKAENYFL